MPKSDPLPTRVLHNQHEHCMGKFCRAKLLHFGIGQFIHSAEILGEVLCKQLYSIWMEADVTSIKSLNKFYRTLTINGSRSPNVMRLNSTILKHILV